MDAGMSMPQASKSVGGTSIKLTGSLILPPPVNPGPVKAIGICREESWQLRLYSLFRVLK
jgi:hypothetical protein